MTDKPPFYDVQSESRLDRPQKPVHIIEAIEPVLAEIRARAASRRFAPRDCTGSPPPRRLPREKT